MRLKLILFILAVFGCVLKAEAQNIEYGATLDTAYMLIGDQQHLTFKVKSDQALKVVFPQLKDTVSRGIEIISGPVRDSLKGKDGKWLYEEKYVITAFDSGMYVIPELPIIVENGSYNNRLRTDPMPLIVNTFQVDEQKGNYDIVAPYLTPWAFAEILPYVLWGIPALLFVVVIGWLIVRSRKNKPLFRSEKMVVPPYVRAIQELDELKGEKLWQAGKVKEYYTKLTDTIRLYLNDELSIPAMEQTSFETIQELENNKKVDRGEREKIAEMLRVADFVKFAKAMPLPDENSRSMDTAYAFINSIHQRLSAEQKAAEEEKTKNEEAEKADTETVNP